MKFGRFFSSTMKVIGAVGVVFSAGTYTVSSTDAISDSKKVHEVFYNLDKPENVTAVGAVIGKSVVNVIVKPIVWLTDIAVKVLPKIASGFLGGLLVYHLYGDHVAFYMTKFFGTPPKMCVYSPINSDPPVNPKMP